MLKEIKYGGITATPSDYLSPDGDLTCLVNLVPEDGELQPVKTPEVLFTLPSGYYVFFMHKGNGYTHYIIRNGSSLYWIDKDNATGTITARSLQALRQSGDTNPFANTTINGINAIGNTLVVLTASGMHYILWTGATTGYKYLGTHIPELTVSFSLQGEMVRGEEFDITFDNIGSMNSTSASAAIAGNLTPSDEMWKEFTDDNKKKITEQVLAKVNKFIADKSTNAGKFIFPFFVRYAYRLYDQSLIMHSAPALMICSSGVTPTCFVTKFTQSDGEVKKATLRLAAMIHELDYAVMDDTSFKGLGKWSDIVKSVDIFISKPIYTYDQNGECARFVNKRYLEPYSVCKHINQQPSAGSFPLQYQQASFRWLYAKTFDSQLQYPTWTLDIPKRDEESVKGDIIDNAQFYLLKSIPVDNLSTSRTKIPVGKEYLQSLVNREAMTDDYDSHDTLIPKYSFAYNSRINIANLTKKLFGGFHSRSLFQYTDGWVQNYDNLSPTYNNRTITAEVFYFIRQEGKEFVTHSLITTYGFESKFLYLFYPNVNAYKAIVRIIDVFAYNYEVPLQPHPTLNGAYYFDGWTGVTDDANRYYGNLPTASTDLMVSLPNKIYTSEVNNPFHFPALGINTVGTGYIMGICAAVKALSQGQFGQFPLYAFTDEGVWSLEVSKEGKYTARQPVTRDVCINPDSITQTDTAVLFATDRGIMLLSGSNSACITDTLKEENLFDINALQYIDLTASASGSTAIATATGMNVGFRTFLRGVRMLYDYANQRIVAYNPDYSFAYVYSLKSRQWGAMACAFSRGINSYPDALAMAAGAEVVNVSTTTMDDSQTVPALIVTRPLKLDAADILKTVSTVIQRGRFHTNAVSQVLYGSRDLISWHLIGSSTDQYLRRMAGTPYKYFRILAICNLYKGESIVGCSIEYNLRHTNRPR